MRYSKLLGAVCAASLLLTACGKTSTSDQPGNGKWRDSSIIGSVTESDEIRLQDDFAAAVNKDFIVNASPGDGTMRAAILNVLEKKNKLIEELPDEGETGELKRFVALASDWEMRNREGAEPLRKFLEAIEAISSIEDLTRYQCDPEINPLGLGVLMPLMCMNTEIDPTVSAVVIDTPQLSLGGDLEYRNLSSNGLEAREKTNRMTEHILGKLGYDAGSIKKMLKGNYRFEKKMALAEYGLPEDDKKDHMRGWEDTVAAAEGYPLEKIMSAWNIPKEGTFYLNKKQADRLIPLYSEKNLEEIKSMLIVHTVMSCSCYLDRETFDLSSELSQTRLLPPDEVVTYSDEIMEQMTIYQKFVGKSACGPTLDKYYLEAYSNDEIVKDIEKLTADIIAEFHEIFAEEDWLSEKGRELCLEKLDAIKVHVIVPDFDMLDVSDFHVIPEEEGGNFLEAEMESSRIMKEQEFQQSSHPFDRGKWYPTTSTTETNAYYSPGENGIYILAGFITDPLYTPDMTYEEKLAGIGTTIGHELTHAFDKQGARYDKDGFENTWMPLEDQINFGERCTKVSAYYQTIQPFPGRSAYSGDQVTAEATADMGGIRVALSMASKIEGFDYDAFFRRYAEIFNNAVYEDDDWNSFVGDVHPLNYLRINVGVQQFEEFYNTYGVQKGDGMYLAKDKRIAVW